MTLRTLDMGNHNPEYQRNGMISNIFSSIARAFKIGSIFTKKAGDQKQLGGEFVFVSESTSFSLFPLAIQSTQSSWPRFDRFRRSTGIHASNGEHSWTCSSRRTLRSCWSPSSRVNPLFSHFRFSTPFELLLFPQLVLCATTLFSTTTPLRTLHTYIMLYHPLFPNFLRRSRGGSA